MTFSSAATEGYFNGMSWLWVTLSRSNETVKAGDDKNFSVAF